MKPKTELEEWKKYDELAWVLYRLDWISILGKAIELRPSSWAEHPVLEWKNASDTILYSLMLELEKLKR